MTADPPGAPGPITRPEPLRAAVYDRVVELILSGHYAPGAALTEAGLSRTLEVSRTPVREALLRLQAEGVLRSTLARGFTVRPLAWREAAELYPVLANLEGFAVRTIGSVRARTVDTLRATQCELEGCADPARRWKLDTAWHTAIVTEAGNQYLLGLLGQLRTNLSRFELAYMREFPSRARPDRQHRQIMTALTKGNLGRAATLLERHWLDGMRLILGWLADHEQRAGTGRAGAGGADTE